jgi:hypothetical protein
MYKSRLLLRCAAVLVSMAILTTASQAQQKTAKVCEAEWTANKASIQGSGKTKKAFMIECRSGSGPAATAPSAAPPARQGAASTETTPAPAAPRAAKRNRTGTTISTGAAEYASELEAKAHCPGETVVWANTHSKVYHFAGSRSYGNTKKGAYMCEKDTASAGLRSAKNEKRPQ